MLFEPIFPKYQFRFWKGHNEQHYLLVMIETWKKCLDRNGLCVLTDFLKEFDCLPQSL